MTGELALTIATAVHEAQAARNGLAVAAALNCVEPSELAAFFHTSLLVGDEVDPIGEGLPASPGAASGRVVLSADEAALEGPAQVKGALIASTATTVAIFLPVVFLPDEAGQLFADLALTIAFAVVASMLFALLVLPTLSGRWLHRRVPVRGPPHLLRPASLLPRQRHHPRRPQRRPRPARRHLPHPAAQLHHLAGSQR